MKTVFFLTRNDFESAWQGSSTALTAKALGDEVICILSFAALRGWASARFGSEYPAEMNATAARGEAIGAAHPQAMLTQLHDLGAKFLACDTTVRLCGLSAETLVKQGVLDGVEGLSALWKHTDGARVLTF